MTVVVNAIASHACDVGNQDPPFNTEVEERRLWFGTDKNGLPQVPVMCFRGLDIPANSTINAASIANDVISSGAGSGSFIANIVLLSKDGLWDQASIPIQWAPSVSDDDWHVQVLDVSTVLVTTGIASSARQEGPSITGDLGIGVQRLAQGVTITTGGTATIARVSLGGSFSPGTGNVWIQLWSDVGGLPGALLATSDTRPISDIAPKIMAQLRPTYDFVFPVGEQIAISASQKIHTVLRTDVVGGVGVHPGTWRYAYAGGNLSPYGLSPDAGFVDQSYLTVDDLMAIPVADQVSSWAVPIVTAPLTTPSLTSLLQTFVDSPGYLQTDSLGIRYDHVSGNGRLALGAYPGTLGTAAIITVDYTEPPVSRRRVRLIT